MNVFEKIEAQQKGKEYTASWGVGEQLKAICRAEPDCAEIISTDLDNKDMRLEKAEKKIKAWADSHKKGNCVFVPPEVADGILREFYGLPAAGAKQEAPKPQPPEETKATEKPSGSFLDLDDFL